MLRKAMGGMSAKASGAQRQSGKSHLVWRLEKYARLVPIHDKRTSTANQNGGGPGGSESGTWKHYDDAELGGGGLRMSLLDGGHLLVGTDNEVYESLVLWNAQKWLRVARKGDSLLFVCMNVGQASQRFRVRFCGNEKEEKCSESVCRECAAVLCQYTPVKELAVSSTDSTAATDPQPTITALPHPSNGAASGSGRAATATASGGVDTGGDASKPHNSVSISNPEISCTDAGRDPRLSVGSLARRLLSTGGGGGDDEQPLRQAYGTAALDQGTVWPVGQLSSMIHLCLTDSNFPAFVEQVDRELAKLVAND